MARLLVASVVALSLIAGMSAQDTAEWVARQVRDRNTGRDSRAELRMRLYDRQGRVRERALTMLRLRGQKGTGDRALIRLVESARRHLGPRDWVGRWGGDEFLLGIHDELGPARHRVTEWLASLGHPAGTGFPVYASAGCACYHGQDAMGLYREADAAMYEAKFAGGNSLVCHVPARGCVEAA